MVTYYGPSRERTRHRIKRKWERILNGQDPGPDSEDDEAVPEIRIGADGYREDDEAADPTEEEEVDEDDDHGGAAPIIRQKGKVGAGAGGVRRGCWRVGWGGVGGGGGVCGGGRGCQATHERLRSWVRKGGMKAEQRVRRGCHPGGGSELSTRRPWMRCAVAGKRHPQSAPVRKLLVPLYRPHQTASTQTQTHDPNNATQRHITPLTQSHSRNPTRTHNLTHRAAAAAACST